MLNEEIFYKLKGCGQAVAFLLREYPQCRNMGVDEFLSFFKSKRNGCKWSSETVRRSRQKIQNTFKIFPRNTKPNEWKEPIKKLNVNHIVQTSFL